MRLHANLDCEARWSGLELPGKVASRVSLYASLFAALAPGDEPASVWAPAAVDPARLVRSERWTPPVMHVGTPAHADLRWAQDDAKAANDRRLALSVAASLGAALPGARVIESVDELAIVTGRWVCKAPWTSAGRDRCHGDGPPTRDQRTRLSRLLARSGALVFEPWLERILDVGVCATVQPDATVIALPAHGLASSTRGAFLGIDLAPPALLPAEARRLGELTRASGQALFELGYAGPFAIDAFAYRDGDTRRFHPLCEINARYTFGWIARALGSRLEVTRLGFTTPPPGSTVLIAPAADGVTAWCA